MLILKKTFQTKKVKNEIKPLISYQDKKKRRWILQLNGGVVHLYCIILHKVDMNLSKNMVAFIPSK